MAKERLITSSKEELDGHFEEWEKKAAREAFLRYPTVKLLEERAFGEQSYFHLRRQHGDQWIRDHWDEGVSHDISANDPPAGEEPDVHGNE